MTTTSSSQTARLPRAFNTWLGAATLSGFGDGVLYFALGWAASGLGPRVAALVLTAVTASRSVLLLAGGVLTDRWGPRLTLVVGNSVLIALTLLLAVVVHLDGASTALLLATGTVLGVVDAFVIPAGGALPRMLVDGEDLPRALALRGSAGQAAALLGAPASGALVALVGLAGAALVDAGTFAVVVAVLLAVRPRHELPRTAETAAGRSLFAEASDGIHLVLHNPQLRTAVAAVALVAAAHFPVTSLCLPLIARSQDWGAGVAGLVVGASVAGSLTVSLVVARRGALGMPMRVAAVGALVSAGGVGVLAAAPDVPVAMAGAVLQGLGIGLFVAHIAPLVLGAAPPSHAGRLQAVVMVSQALPLVAVNPLLGVLAERHGARVATAACACALGLAGLLLHRSSRQQRRAQMS